jgi:hypothetical protein
MQTPNGIRLNEGQKRSKELPQTGLSRAKSV